jgi:hypothetical protein
MRCALFLYSKIYQVKEGIRTNAVAAGKTAYFHFFVEKGN